MYLKISQQGLPMTREQFPNLAVLGPIRRKRGRRLAHERSGIRGQSAQKCLDDPVAPRSRGAGAMQARVLTHESRHGEEQPGIVDEVVDTHLVEIAFVEGGESPAEMAPEDRACDQGQLQPVEFVPDSLPFRVGGDTRGRRARSLRSPGRAVSQRPP